MSISFEESNGSTRISSELERIQDRLTELNIPIESFMAHIAATVVDTFALILVAVSKEDEITVEEARDWITREMEDRLKCGAIVRRTTPEMNETSFPDDDEALPKVLH